MTEPIIFQRCPHCGNKMVSTLFVFQGNKNRCNGCNRWFEVNDHGW